MPRGRGSRSLLGPVRAVALAAALGTAAMSCSGSDAAGSRSGALAEEPPASATASAAESSRTTTPTDPGTVPDTAPSTTAADGTLWRTSAIGTLPEGFPTDVPLPPGHRVVVATESTTGSPKSFMLQLVVPGDPHAIFEGLATTFEAGGWEQLQRSTESFGGSPTGTAVYRNGTILVNLGAIPGDDPATTALTYSIVPAEPVVGPGG